MLRTRLKLKLLNKKQSVQRIIRIKSCSNHSPELCIITVGPGLDGVQQQFSRHQLRRPHNTQNILQKIEPYLMTLFIIQIT